MMTLASLGWNAYFENQWKILNLKDHQPGRICEVQRDLFTLLTPHGEVFAELSGRARSSVEALPTIGDWVIYTPLFQGRDGEPRTLIDGVISPQSCIERLAPGGGVQRLASNVDYGFLVTSLNQDLNLRRLERYVALMHESEVIPVIVLSKADLSKERRVDSETVGAMFKDIKIIVASSVTGDGLSELLGLLNAGKTGVLLGSSGVGKSSLINRLCQNSNQVVQDISEDRDKGRHTTFRTMKAVVSGGWLIDTSGLREIQLVASDESLAQTFNELDGLVGSCRFKDCQHDSEPGCAVRQALRDGTIEISRWNNYLKLKREQDFYERKISKEKRSKQKQKWKKLDAQMKQWREFKRR